MHCAGPGLSTYGFDLQYQGGIDGIGVTTGAPKVYLVFWGSQWGTSGVNSNGDRTFSNDPMSAAPYLQEFFKGVGTPGDGWSAVATQYCQGVRVGSATCPATNNQHVGYAWGGALAGVWEDNSASEPAVATAHQIGQEAIRAAAHFGNTTPAANRNVQYDIVSSTGLSPDGFLDSGFCAWHDWNGDSTLDGGGAVFSPYGDIAFTNMPYVTDVGQSCGQNFVNSGDAGALDGWSIVNGHEFMETITDQNPTGGWFNNTTQLENGDICAWIPPGTPGGSFDLSDGTGTYAVQTTWADDAHVFAASGCEGNHPVVRNP
ncbi:MAG TPA: hypothetical protein VKU39_03225 [Streptosporangiaceae bacterium]|nr:hypothetical protein [Streptosporangiaceae bacterium]